jgi:hypothetical protein
VVCNGRQTPKSIIGNVLSPFLFQSPPFWWLMLTQTKANIRSRNATSLQFWQICISYFEFKPTESMSKYIYDCFLLFSILDHFCTTCLFFANLLEKSFQILLQIAKGLRIWFPKSTFKILKILPLFQMLFLWLNRSSPEEVLPLAVKRVFSIEMISSPLWNSLLFENGGGAVLLLWAY